MATDHQRIEFTPFLAEKLPLWRDDVTAALRRLLGVPETVPLTWRTDLPRGQQLDVIATIGEGTRVELHVPPSAGQAYFRGTNLSFSYRDADGDNGALLSFLRRRLEAVDRLGADGAPLAELRAAWQQWQSWQHLHDRQLREFSEGGGLIRLGFACNQDCSFCWQARQDPDPPEAILHAWIDDLVRFRTHKVTFSGGEPTAYKSLLPLMQYARARDLQSWLQTNAIALANPTYLQRLIDAGLTGVLISYHSADAAISDLVTRAPGTHVRTEAGIRACLQAGLEVALNGVVERRTLAGMPEVARRIVADFLPLAQQAGQLGFGFAWPQSFLDRKLWLEQMVPLDEARPCLQETVRILHAAGIAVHPVGACGFPLCAVADVLDLFAPLSLDMLADEDLLPRSYPDACAGCSQRGRCPGVRKGYLETFGERGIVAIG